MLGKITVDKVGSIVDPLRALNDVLKDKTDGVHIVYEFEEDRVFVGARNASGDCYGMYELNVKNVVEGYEKSVDEIVIYDVGDFVNKINLFDDDFNISFDEESLLTLSNDTDDANFYSSDITLIKKGKRKLKTTALDIGAKLEFSEVIPKIQKAIASYVGQDTITFEGNSRTNEVIIKISSDQRKSNSYKTVIKDVEVENDFSTSFQKDQIKSVLSCNDGFDVTFFT